MLTACIAEIGILIANLDAVAPIITMWVILYARLLSNAFFFYNIFDQLDLQVGREEGKLRHNFKGNV